MKPIKSFLFVIATIAAAICEGEIQWRVSRVYDEFGNTPTFQSFVGYFVPTYEDLNGQLVDRVVVLEMLRHGDIQSARAYMVGETYVGFKGNMSSGPFFDYVPEAGQTVSGFAVVFDSPSIETATKFAATEEQSQSVGYTGATKTTFYFANSIGIDAWETIGSATSGYEYLGGTWYYSANGDGTLTITSVEPGSSMALTIPDAIDGCPVTVVGDNAFDNCTTITNVVIPSSITSIGDSAFHSCSGLTSVTIPDSVTNIGDSAFDGCSGLTSVTIPDSVTNIGDSAFYDCCGLTSVTIPGSVTSIGSYVFSSCSGLTSVTIPDSVTSIGSYAFSGCSGLTSVTIPDSVTNIGSYAFSGCSGLTSVTIPNSVTNIGSYAFSDCSGLTSVTIPDSVTNIGDHAFYNCRSLTSVTIPDSVMNIGSYAFYNCRSLTSVTIPDSVTNIGDHTFYNCSGLKSVTIPNSVTSIGSYVFSSCSGLTSVTIPDSVTSIGSHVFSSCSGLTSVTIPNSVTNIGSYAFSGCSGLTSVTIPNSVTSIEVGAFFCCSGLTSVTIPNSVTNISIYAFYGCSGLASVTIPDSVTSIGSSSFFGCSESLFDTATIPGVKLVDGWAVGNAGALSGDLNLTDIRGIGRSAFYGCSGLTSVTIPDSVTNIGDHAFSDCSGLTSVTFEGDAPVLGNSVFNGVSADCTVFVSCDSKGWGVDIPGEWNGLPIEYFDGEPEPEPEVHMWSYSDNGDGTITITGVELGSSRALTIPDAIDGCPVTVVGDNAFEGCTTITNVVIPSSITSIGDFAFYDCSGLKSVTIPDSVTSIGNSAFSRCRGLTGVYINNIVKWCEISFGDVFANPIVYAQDLYLNGKKIDALTIPDGVTNICSYSFPCCSGLMSVTISSSVTNIGDLAFYNCSGLTSVMIPNSVTSIGIEAFEGCSGLTSVSIPNSVVSIDSRAFYICSGLTSVTIPNSVTNIGRAAFYGCRCLTSVTFEGDAPVLGNSVFDGVSADCTVFVSCDSKGWGVDIPGEWNGLPIEYFDGEPEPPEPPEPEIHTVVFDFGEHGKGFVDGELVGGAIEQMVLDGEPVDPPVVVPDEGWLFFDWVGEFDVGEPITCDTGFVAMYVEEPMPPTADLNYAIESLYIKQGDLRDGNLEIHVAFNLREGFDWLDVADALQNQCDIRVLSGHSYNDLWCEDCGESQSLVFDNDSETLIATVALSGIASRRYYRIVVHDMVDGVFSTDIGMLAYRDGEYVFVTGAAMFEWPGPTKIVECEDWFSMSPLTVSTADCVRFHYDLDEINRMLWGYTRRDREYREPFYAVVVNEDLGIEHIAKVNIETLLHDWVSDTIPSAGYFDWDVYCSTVLPGERYMVGFLPESYIDGDHVIDDFWLLEDFAGLLFEVSVIDGNLPPVETHTVTFYVGEYGERIGGGELVQTVVDGETAVVPEVRTNEDRLFIGWDGDVTAPVTDDIAFTAMYHTAYLWLNFHCGDHGLIGIEGVREYDFSAFPVLYPYNSYSGSLMWARIDENGEYTSDGNRYQFSLLSPPIIDYEGWHCIGWRNSEDGEFFPINNYDEEGGHLYSNAYVSVTLPVDSCLENSPEWVDFEPVYVEVEPPAETYAVTFDLGGHGARAGGGELVQSVPFGETAVAPLVLADEGWSFTGWDGDVTAAVTGDVVFSAQWERAKINVRINGEETICDYGDTVTFTAPEPWEADGVQIVTLGTTFTDPVVTNAFTVTVTNGFEFVWDIFATNWWFEVAETQNGSIAGAETGWIADGEEFILAAVPAEHYHFVGWTGDTEGCVETNGTELAVAMDHPRTIGAEFAKVEPPAETYAVTFDLGGHGARTGGGELVQLVPFGETAVAPLVLADEGWSFTGWDGDVTAAVTGDVVFSAQWERAKIKVRINGEETICDYGDMVTFTAPEPWEAEGVQIVTLGTTFTDPVVTNAFTVTVTNGFEFVWDIFATNWWFEVAETQNGSIAGAGTGWIADGEEFILAAVPAEHYHFVGWTGDTEGCVETNGTELAVAMDHPRTIGAEFAIDTFTVTFEAGAHGALVGEAVQTIDYGGTAAVPEVTSDVGYEFTGWSGDVAAPVVGDVTFTAQYATVPYAITYSGLKGAVNPNPATYTIEDAVTFAAPGEVYGWVFTGWTPASIAAGSTGSIEVTANWERAKFDVTVNGETRQYSYGEEATFTAPEPWDADGVQIVTLGTTFTAPVLTNEFSLVVTSDISFEWDVCATNYWLEVAAPEHGSIVGAESGWQPAYSEVIFEPVADEGYHFAGWTGDMADCALDGDMLAVEMRGPKSIGAEFALDIVAVIDGISPVSPSEDDAIILQGRAENGTAQEYLWRAVNMASGKASVIGRAQVCRAKLPMGEWRLEFLAKDLFGAWSAPASRDVTVSATTAAPDLQIARADVSFVDSLGLPTSHVKTGDAVAVRAVVVNRGAARLQNGAMVYLCDGIIPVADLAGLSRSDSRVIAQGTVSPLGAGRSQTVEFAWDVGRNAVGAVRAYDDGPNAFTVAVVPVGDAAQERTIENNLASMMLEIGESGESPSAMLRASANCHDQIWEGEEYSVSGYVWYERNEHRAMMAGASVLLSIDGEVVAETLTDAYGFYVCSFVAPPAGSHEAVIKAIDGTVVYSGACEFSSLERQGSGESGGEGAEPGIDVPVLRGANIAVAAVECTGVEVRRESAAAYAAYVDEDVGVRATILNTGDVAVTNGFVVSFLMTPEVGGSASQVDVAIADEILPGGTIVVACPETLTPQDEMRWVVRVVADAEDAVLEYSETDNSGRVWLAVEERRPNLVVTGISLSDQRPCDGTDEVVNVHVRNVGSAPVTESFAVELSVGDADRRMIVDGGLPVGGEATVETLVRLYDWMTRIVATADADGVIAEDDESDNSYSRTVLVYPVEANVSPVALSASPYPRAGQTCVLTATFRNDGGTAYSGGTAAFYDGDSAIGEGAVGPIAWKGGTGQATCAWTPAGNDDHSVRVVLDGKTYTVKFSKTPPPDLRVVADDISFEPGTPSAGEAVRFRAMVRNVGSSMPATDVSVVFSVAASDGIYRALTTMKVPTIAAGGSVAVDADMPFVVEQGVYSVQVAVCDGEGREADPADNLAVRTFGVNMPVASATAEATCIVGDTITLDGTGSTGATGFRWTLLEAPTGGIFDVSGCTSAVASFVPRVAGVYRFALVVSDGTHESAPAECVVIIDRVRVAATASSGGTVSHDGEAVYAAGAVVVFEAIPETHYHFVGWTGDVDGCEAVGDLRLAVVMDCNRTIYAEFALDEIPVGEAANAPRLEWFSDGAAAWFGEWSADAADGEHAVRSGAIGDNSSSVLGVKLHGAGTLAFDWRSSCEAKYDALRLEVDGKLLRNISGETGWKNVTVELGVGDHEVRWVYAKGRSRSEGQDAVWLDNVSWTPAGVPTFAEALGDFEWVTDGDVSWTAIRNEYAYEGDSFAYADGLGDYEYASLRTTVSGAGRLVFRWAVSCEYWCDWFDFMVDGEVMEMLTGETDWLEVSVDLADGPHEFEWVYWKDEMDYDELAGTNCAMLDYVQWFPAGEEPPVVSEETVSEFFAWLKEHRRLEETDTAGDAAALVADKTPASAKGMTLYQEFVAGTNPDDENDVFTAEIKVSADGVSVTPHPNLGDKRVYTLLGRKTLGGSADDWVEVRAGEEANYNFFKVTVDIK